MAFRRGFKSQCERRSVEIRKDMGLTKLCPLSAMSLADQFGVTVWAVSEIKGLSEEELDSLILNDDDCWSAYTLRFDNEHLIIYKDVNSKARINSVVMHEMSHIILGHELAEAGVLPDGSLVAKNFVQDQEDEADWLGGTLLLPRPILLNALEKRMPTDEVQEHYQVSSEMLEYRIKMTGVRHQMQYRKSRR